MESLPSRKGSGLFLVSATLLLGLTGAQSSAAPAAGFSVSGVVLDGVGSFVDNVELLLVDSRGTASPQAVARSDAAGRFRFDGLEPAIYRIAALKDGYLTFIGRVDPQVESWIQVVLHPMPRLDADVPRAVPQDSSWAMRRARRYVLHDDGPRLTDAVSDTEAVRTVPEDALVMQVDQLFPVASAAGAGDPVRREIRGSETRVRMASAVGERASIGVEGYRELLDSSSRDGAALAAASRDASAVSLAFSYDTASEGQLDVSAFYNQGGLELSSQPVDPLPQAPLAPSARRTHRQWGYDARWSTDLADIGTVAVGLDYHDTQLRVPGASPAPALAASVPDALSTRSVGASGVWTAPPIDDHALQVDVRALALDATDPTSTAITASDPSMSGLSLGLNAQDTWSVAGPFAVIYGLGYRQALGAREASLVVPRVGGLWRMKGLSVRGVVSYNGVTGWSGFGSEAATAAPLRPEDALGYEAEVELPLTRGLRLAGAATYSPIQVDLTGYSGGGFHRDPRPLYLTDGNAAARERRLALIRESHGVRFYLEWNEGAVEGTLATITPYDVPRGFLAPGDLDYRTGRLGVRVFPSGTDLLVQYQSLVQVATGDAGAGASDQRAFEIRLSQDLMDLEPLGSWRLLVALRRAALHSDRPDEVVDAHQAEIGNSLNDQLSAGLSVSF